MTFSSVNTIWVLLGAALVFFMQAGFSMCEAGFTRAEKHRQHPDEKPHGLLHRHARLFPAGLRADVRHGQRRSSAGWIRALRAITRRSCPPACRCGRSPSSRRCSAPPRRPSFPAQWPSARSFSAYCIYSAAISLLIYPISGHWIWGGGWLSQMGFHDFAGSTAVHMVGGVCALIGAKILGPRIGKYDKNGKPRAILGHNLSLAALGVFILWFCWFGFNGASTVGMDSDELVISAGLVFFNTNMAAAVACCTTMIITWIRYGKPDVSMTYNAALAGLVGVTAGCDAISPVGAAIIGLATGTAIVFAVELFDKELKIDDPGGRDLRSRRVRRAGHDPDRPAGHGRFHRKGTFLRRRPPFPGRAAAGRALRRAVCGADHYDGVHDHPAHHRPARRPRRRADRPGYFRARPAQRLRRLRHVARRAARG